MRYLKMTGFVILYIGIFFACSQLFGWLIGSAYRDPSMVKIMDTLLGEWKLWVLLFLGVPLLLYMLVFKIRKMDFFEFCRFRRMSAKDIILACSIGIATSLFTSHFINLSFIVKWIPQFTQYVDDAVKGNIFAVIILSVVLLMFCEEVLFRGLIFNELRAHVPLVIVLFVHTLFYMPFQPNLQVAGFAYVNFTLYALVYVFCDSLWAPILVQVVGAIGLYGLRLTGMFTVMTDWGDPYLGIVALISLILIIVLTLALKKQPFKNIFAWKKEGGNAVSAETSEFGN